MRRLSIGVLVAVGCAACGPDPSSIDGSCASDPGTDPAYLFVNRVRTLFSRINYMSLLPSLDPTEPELGDAVEVPGASRFIVQQGKVFVFRGESGQVSRYCATNALGWVEERRFSMANVGVSAFGTGIAFPAANRAYYVDAAGAQVVVFDPTEMVLTSSFDVPGLLDPDYPLTVVGTPAVLGDEVIVPIGWRTNDQSSAVFATAILVLSATSDEVIGIVKDPRCGPGLSGFVYEGSYYALGDWDAGAYDVLLPDPDEERIGACLLRYTPGDDGFDPDYLLDMTEVTGRPQLNGAFGTIDGRVVTRVWDAEDSPAEVAATLTDPAEYFGLELWRWAVVDMATEQTTILGDLELSGTSFNPSVVDEWFYVPLIDEASQTSVSVEIDGTAARETVRAPGDIIAVGRLR